MGATSAQTDLLYNFNADAEGFQNAGWQAASPAGWTGGSTVKQTHAAGGWQMQLTKEFDWQAGGGSANQQVEMQSLANLGGRLAFDIMIDGGSFPPECRVGLTLMWWETAAGRRLDAAGKSVHRFRLA